VFFSRAVVPPAGLINIDLAVKSDAACPAMPGQLGRYQAGVPMKADAPSYSTVSGAWSENRCSL
jgi:hypothetical protein